MSSTELLPALLQLASAALPIGGFGYSGGLEAAVDRGLVHDEASAAAWLEAMLDPLWAEGDARHWCAAFHAFAASDADAFADANTLALAMRETAELRLESEQMGRSLALWLRSLRPDDARVGALTGVRPLAHACAHAAACGVLALTPAWGLHALGWSWLENLGIGAVKLIPLGQDAGQRLLHGAARRLPSMIANVLAETRAPSNFAPMLTILSSQHETQYSRLFRS